MNSYKDLIPHRRFPLVILNLTMAPDSVDVNIHPQKMEVKFLQPGFIFDAILKSINLSLQTAHQLGTVVDSGTFPSTGQTTAQTTGQTITSSSEQLSAAQANSFSGATASTIIFYSKK